MKSTSVVLLVVLVSLVIAGCGAAPAPAPAPKPAPAPAPAPAPKADAVTGASTTDNEAGLIKAMSKEGTWIIITTKDIKTSKELVLDGTFKNGKKDDKGNDIIQRKIAPYNQDDKKNVTARYTIEAPKLTINSPEARIQAGTFKGDVYVSAKNFQLVEATVTGNVYFTTDEAKSTFKMDGKSKVSGKIELKK